VICNFSNKPITVPCTSDDNCAVLLASHAACQIDKEIIRLPAESVVIVGPSPILENKACLWSPDFENRTIPEYAWASV
jgi:hypothetical protein